jgi:phage terminase small subunit
MAPLKNNQHERFCLAILSGKNQSEAAIEAGYKPSRSRQTGCFLVTKSNILARLEGLKQAAADAKIADVVECKRVLTEIIHLWQPNQCHDK